MRVELRDALEFLYVDSVVSGSPRRSMTVDVPRGGTGSFHVLLCGLSIGETVRFAILRDGRVVRNAEWFRLVDVPVEKNTGPLGLVEKCGERNPFVTRRAPFRVYDAMEPVQGSVEAVSSTMALRAHLPAGRGKAGQREYRVEVQHERETRILSFRMNIHKPAVPGIGKESFPCTFFYNLNHMADRHGLRPWSESHWRMIRRYAEVMARARQNTFRVSLSDVFTKRGKAPSLDRRRLRRIVRLFSNAGMYYIEGGHVAGKTGRDWNATTFDIGLGGARATSNEGNAILAGIVRQLMREIERNGWQKRWIQHVADEPVEATASDYRILVGMVRKYMPGQPILDATKDLGLVGSLDIWCPEPQEYQKHRRYFEAQQALGDRVWFYTCCMQGGPLLNRLLDMELLRPALFGWSAARFRLEGYLHWALNCYRPHQDPFRQSVIEQPGGSLPAGETHIVYPGPDGPWSSLRLEAHREGFEDYELLRRLRVQDEESVTKIIRRVIRGFDKYTKSVRTFRSARRDMLEALDRD